MKRRELLIAAGGVLFLGACRLLSEARGTQMLISKPHPEAWRPVLRAFIASALPFEHPEFPDVSLEQVEAELLRLFPLDEDPDLTVLTQALVLFDASDTFDAPVAPLVAAERDDLEAQHRTDSEIDAWIEQAVDHERAASAQFRARHGDAPFVSQSQSGRDAYLRLWANSALLARRRMVRGFKAIVMISAYSMPPFWRAVGYDGPLIGRR